MVILANDGVVRIERLELGPWGTNAYVVTCLRTGDSALVDAPADSTRITRALHGTNLKYILLTHGHGDHTGALPALKAMAVPVAAHAADSVMLRSPPDVLLDDGDLISVGKVVLEVIHTPGHTPGSLCFGTPHYLLCGDTIFPGGPGKTASPADFQRILKSITEKVLTRPDGTALYPGHGAPTTVRQAREELALFSARPHRPDLCGDVLWVSS